MKHSYILYIVLIIVVFSRNSIINITSNIYRMFFLQSSDIEVSILKRKYDELRDSYSELIDFKSNINIDERYVITNIFKNNYGFNKLLINGDNYGYLDEVVNEAGLVGLVSKIGKNISEVDYIYNTDIPVMINNNKAKILSHDKDNNLIIGNISNYNDIKLNDKVYSLNDTYIGRVINIKIDSVSAYLIVKTIDLTNLKYVGVISKL